MSGASGCVTRGDPAYGQLDDKVDQPIPLVLGQRTQRAARGQHCEAVHSGPAEQIAPGPLLGGQLTCSDHRIQRVLQLLKRSTPRGPGSVGCRCLSKVLTNEEGDIEPAWLSECELQVSPADSPQQTDRPGGVDAQIRSPGRLFQSEAGAVPLDDIGHPGERSRGHGVHESLSTGKMPVRRTRRDPCHPRGLTQHNRPGTTRTSEGQPGLDKGRAELAVVIGPPGLGLVRHPCRA